MYPREKLIELAWRKGELRQRIAARRDQCVAGATRVTRPLVWLDQALDLWRQLAPFAALAALPLGEMLRRSIARRWPRLRQRLHWGSLLLGALGRFSRAQQTRAAGQRVR